MYAKGNDFIKDFATRTKANIEELQGSPYEVTQLINSMVGLLIIPEQKQFKKIVDSLVETDLWNQIVNCITVNTYTTSINLQQICRHLRNSIAHSSIDFEAIKPSIKTQPLIIHSISFTDSNPRNKSEKIMIKMPISLLKEFLYAFSDAMGNLP